MYACLDLFTHARNGKPAEFPAGFFCCLMPDFLSPEADFYRLRLDGDLKMHAVYGTPLG